MPTRYLSLFLNSLFFFFQIYGYCFFMTKVQSLSAASDTEALLTLKSTVSDPQNILRNWTHNTSHCTWYGVSCSNRGSRVRSLNLSGAGLTGPLTPQLSNLTFLFLLDLSINSFHGPIPSELGLLSHLEYLYLQNNNINGTIPASLSQCSKLKNVFLSYNQLVGSIPSQLGSLQRLEILYFYDNNLTGSVPTSFGNLSSLYGLALGRNKLFGEIPTELGRLRKLQFIELSENLLSGEIPYSIFNISSLVVLSLTENKLVGRLPDDLGLFVPNLQQLLLAQNSLQGAIPGSLSNASGIQVLDLTGNDFEGPIPLFGRMSELSVLELGSNHLTSTTTRNFQLIESLKNCTRLEVFRVQSNKLAGEFPSSVANLSTHLLHFCISDNSLSGRFPEGMENFQALISLSIEQNNLSGEIPKNIGTLKNLQNFLAFDNMFSGEIPDIFGNFSQLSNLAIGNNQFSGRIPLSIAACQRLNVLNLTMNRLNGSIPTEIVGISTLIYLNLRQNSLTGSLPDVGKLKQLQYIIVSDNHLSGNITSSIGDCSSLLVLNLSRNYFTGTIPDTTGNLTSLVALDLSSNRLVGTVPEELEKIESLMMLNLSFNNLEGQIPSDGVFKNHSRVYLQGNNGLCHNNQTTAENLGLPQCFLKTRKKHYLIKIVAPVAVIACIIILLFCFVSVLIFRKKQQKESNKRSLSPPSFMDLPTKISYNDIRLATNNFAAEHLLGKGGFGSVYKGTFHFENESSSTETILAIKVLDLQQSKAVRSFDAECEALRNVRHRNLVKLITSCSSIQHNGDEFKALIMEFMSHSSLEKWLYHDEAETDPSLNLLQRLNIIIDVGSAMEYLHHDCNPPVVHCDLKPGNVLLDDNMVAHVGDFGLSRILFQDSSEKDSSTIGLKGSIGYIPPEYGMGSKPSTAGDVYSFGMLLLETFTAMKPTDGMFNLNKFASAVTENHVQEIADPMLFKDNVSTTTIADPMLFKDNVSTTTSSDSSDSNSRNGGNGSGSSHWLSKTEECVGNVIRVGLSCAAHLPSHRLTMREAIPKLLEIKKVAMEKVPVEDR